MTARAAPRLTTYCQPPGVSFRSDLAMSPYPQQKVAIQALKNSGFPDELEGMVAVPRSREPLSALQPSTRGGSLRSRRRCSMEGGSYPKPRPHATPFGGTSLILDPPGETERAGSLVDAVRSVIRVRRMTTRTEMTYLDWLR